MKRTLLNLVSVVGGEGLLRLANFVVVVVVARRYTSEILGLYAAAMAYVGVATMTADNGLQISAVTEVTRGCDNLSAAVSRLYVAKTLLFVFMAAILLGIGFCAQLSTFAWIVSILTVIRFLLQSYSQLQFSVIKALGRAHVIGIIQAMHFTLLMSGITWAYLAHRSFYLVLTWFIVGQSLEIVLSASVLFRHGIRPVRVRLWDCLALLRRSTAVGVSYALATVILRTDVIVLSMIASISVVGNFAAAQVVITVVYVVSWLFGSVVLPELTRRRHAGLDIEAYVSRGTFWLLVSTVPTTLLIALVTPWLLGALYGPSYASTGPLAAVMLLAAPFILLNALNFNRAIALESRSLYVGTYVWTAVLAVVLDLAFGLTLGTLGVAIAVVLREAAMLAIFRIGALRSADIAAQRA